MGNRAVITHSTHPRAPSVYLHWNGGRASVEAFLEAARRLGLRHVAPNEARSMDMLADMIARHFFGGHVGFTVYRQPLGRADCDNWDNGLYVVDNDWRIVERRYLRSYEEVNAGKTAEILEHILQRAPVFNFEPERGQP